jgi:hypothetical protein
MVTAIVPIPGLEGCSEQHFEATSGGGGHFRRQTPFSTSGKNAAVPAATGLSLEDVNILLAREGVRAVTKREAMAAATELMPQRKPGRVGSVDDKELDVAGHCLLQKVRVETAVMESCFDTLRRSVLRGNSGSLSATHVQSIPFGVVDAALLEAAFQQGVATIILKEVKAGADVRDPNGQRRHLLEREDVKRCISTLRAACAIV